jgi:hypothetical protein
MPSEHATCGVPAKSIRRLRKTVTEMDSSSGSTAPARSPARRPHRGRSGAHRHHAQAAAGRRDHALRPRAPRRHGPRLHPPPPLDIARVDRIPKFGAARPSSLPSGATGKPSTRAGGALALALFDQTQTVTDSAIASASGWNLRRCCTTSGTTSATRAPPALLLPDQERRPARLRAGGDRESCALARYHRRGRRGSHIG